VSTSRGEVQPATKEKAAVLIEGFVECPLEAAKVGNQPMIA